jgi:catechol 2,3-dioxygenase-like lactoylglutathione lyase family enzyme
VLVGLWMALALTLLPSAGLTQAASPQPLIAGVDAIGMTVSDMDRSVGFYSQVLSFQKVSEVEVVGEDYEHLEGVFGLRMRVVRMRLGHESIELTQYLTPRGRPFPADERANDIAHWQTHLMTEDAEGAAQRLRAGHFAFASSAVVRLQDGPLAGMKSTLVRDPDGHVMQLIESEKEARR